MDIATFAAGCFWGVEARFRQLPGVIDTRVGYTGGCTPYPTYKQVCSGQTGHAEAIEIQFDPQQITYRDLLKAFWRMHTPTKHHRRRASHDGQYRSAIFYHDQKQQQQAEDLKAELEQSGRFAGPLVTEISAAEKFYAAEDYHQRYLEKRGRSSRY